VRIEAAYIPGWGHSAPEGGHEVSVALHGSAPQERWLVVRKETDVLPVALRRSPLSRPIGEEQVRIAGSTLQVWHGQECQDSSRYSRTGDVVMTLCCILFIGIHE